MASLIYFKKLFQKLEEKQTATILFCEPSVILKCDPRKTSKIIVK